MHGDLHFLNPENTSAKFEYNKLHFLSQNCWIF